MIMDGLWKPLAMAFVGVIVVVSSRRYIRDASELSESSSREPARRYWRTVARWEQSTLWVGWAVIVVSLVALVVRIAMSFT
jgi:hypothetical protein